MSPFRGAEMAKMPTDGEACLGPLAMHAIDKDDIPLLTGFPSESQILAFQKIFTKMANNFGIKLQDPEHSELADKFWKDVNKLFYPHLDMGHLMMVYTAGPSDFHKIVLPATDSAYLCSWEMHGIGKDDVPFLTLQDPSASNIIIFRNFYTEMANKFGIKLQSNDPGHKEMEEKYWKDVRRLFYPHLDIGHLAMLYHAKPEDFHKIVLPEIDQHANKKRKRARGD